MDRVELVVDDGVAQVRLNRPDKLNALDDAMFGSLAEAIRACRESPDVRAVVLSGAGRSFCAGLDMGVFAAMADGRQWRPADADSSGPDVTGPDGVELTRGQRLVWSLATLPVPVIAAVHGHAVGGGLQLALAADIRIVAPDARLGVLEIDWGLCQDMLGTQILPRLVGLDVAKELTFTGRIVTGVEAVHLGLATRTADDPGAAALDLARSVAGRSPTAIRNAKRLLSMSWTHPLAAAVTEEALVMRAQVGSPQQREATRARLERRAPDWDRA